MAYTCTRAEISVLLLYFQLQEHRWQYILVEQMTFSWSSGMFPEEKMEKYLLLAFFFEPLLFTTFFSDFIVTLSLIIFVICLLKSIKNLLNTFMHSAFAEGLSRNRSWFLTINKRIYSPVRKTKPIHLKQVPPENWLSNGEQ